MVDFVVLNFCETVSCNEHGLRPRCYDHCTLAYYVQSWGRADPRLKFLRLKRIFERMMREHHAFIFSEFSEYGWGYGLRLREDCPLFSCLTAFQRIIMRHLYVGDTRDLHVSNQNI